MIWGGSRDKAGAALMRVVVLILPEGQGRAGLAVEKGMKAFSSLEMSPGWREPGFLYVGK